MTAPLPAPGLAAVLAEVPPPLGRRGIDRRGDRYGRLTVLRLADTPPGGQKLYWLCRCDCGTEKVLPGITLASGKTISCGCWRQEFMARARDELHAQTRTHGLKDHPLYDTWRGMHRRCENADDAAYPNYGGRGIKVCAEWSGPGGLERFLAHVGDRPSREHSIDRTNNDGDYEPGNVRWATHAEQVRNRRILSDGLARLSKGDMLAEARRARAEAAALAAKVAQQDGILLAMGAVVEAARGYEGHAFTCDAMLTSEHGCSCGYFTLRRAILSLDALVAGKAGGA